jgi:hypothetical protein
MISTRIFLRLPKLSHLALLTYGTPLWPLTVRCARWWIDTLLYLIDYHAEQAHQHKSIAVAFAQVEMTRAGLIRL